MLSIGTLGLYNLLWFYRNWLLFKEQTGRQVSPFWRAWFAPFWAYALFREAKHEGVSHGVNVCWSGRWLGLGYFVLATTVSLPNSWWLLSLLTLAPIAVVQHTINKVNSQAPPL
jgi:hypothetical protein